MYTIIIIINIIFFWCQINKVEKKIWKVNKDSMSKRIFKWAWLSVKMSKRIRKTCIFLLTVNICFESTCNLSSSLGREIVVTKVKTVKYEKKTFPFLYLLLVFINDWKEKFLYKTTLKRNVKKAFKNEIEINFV